MEEAITAEGVVTRTKTATAAKPKRERAKPLTPAAVALWTGAMIAGLLSIVPIVQAVMSEMTTYSLQQTGDSAIKQKLGEATPAGMPADYYETLSELALSVKPADKETALRLARQTVQKDPNRGSAWATIAYVESDLAKTANPASIEALRKSMDVCPLCSPELIRWRFNFVLANWPAVPEDMRSKAFDQADMLRWTGEHAEFLAEMRAKAIARGIPYDAYRGAVDTPARTWDIDTGKAPTRSGAPSKN